MPVLSVGPCGVLIPACLLSSCQPCQLGLLLWQLGLGLALAAFRPNPARVGLARFSSLSEWFPVIRWPVGLVWCLPVLQVSPNSKYACCLASVWLPGWQIAFSVASLPRSHPCSVGEGSVLWHSAALFIELFWGIVFPVIMPLGLRHTVLVYRTGSTISLFQWSMASVAGHPLQLPAIGILPWRGSSGASLLVEGNHAPSGGVALYPSMILGLSFPPSMWPCWSGLRTCFCLTPASALVAVVCLHILVSVAACLF